MNWQGRSVLYTFVSKIAELNTRQLTPVAISGTECETQSRITRMQNMDSEQKCLGYEIFRHLYRSRDYFPRDDSLHRLRMINPGLTQPCSQGPPSWRERTLGTRLGLTSNNGGKRESLGSMLLQDENPMWRLCDCDKRYKNVVNIKLFFLLTWDRKLCLL